LALPSLVERIVEAHDLLLDVYPRVLREDIPEVTSLLQETFQVESEKSRQLIAQ
jgi:hypothetical protein